jgi:transposase-like protein
MPKTKDAPRKPLRAGIGKVLKRLHYPLDVIVLCVRWYVAYSLSLRNLEEMMARANDYRGQERRQSGRARSAQRRALDTDQGPPEQVPE